MKHLLGNTDSLQLFPLSYPWAWDMYLENMDNHWTPREIPVANDVALWRSDGLSEAERHLFLSVMAQLTTFDVQRGDETAESLQGIIDPPEIKHYLKRLADEEALHTWAYQFIIENMGLDPEDIYSRYARVPQMKARVDLANELSSRAKRAWAKRVFTPEAALTLREKQEILFATIFWFLCFEGIWFVMGLSGPIQNLSRHGKFTGAAEQFQYILRDEFQHIRFGIHLINAYIEQYPDCMSKSFVAAIGRLFEETIRLEDDYIRYCLPAPTVGYNVEDHTETAKWYANQRASSIGLPPVYEGAQHRFPWMSEQVSIRKEKNFFETRPTEYRTGGALNWDD